MKTFNRICIKDYSITDTQGGIFEIKRGKEYTTSEEKDGSVIVFTRYWHNVPVNYFAGEQRFT